MTDKDLFNWLAPGECFHEWPPSVSLAKNCLNCGAERSYYSDDRLHTIYRTNPNFSTPQGMVWLMERAIKKGICIDITPGRKGKGLYRYWIRDDGPNSFYGYGPTPQSALRAALLNMKEEG